MYAAVRKNVDIVDRFLTDGRFDLNIRDVKGNAAICYAIKSGNLEIVDKLIAYDEDIHYTNKKNESLLHIASGC